MKIVKNACYGGFNLSVTAMNRLVEITGKSFNQCKDDYGWGDNEIRNAPELVQVVEELGKAASGSYANLVVVDIPDDVQWCMRDYDGWETIEEVHRSW